MRKNNLQVLSPCSLYSSSFLCVFFLKNVSFLKIDFGDECRGDHGRERYGEDMVK